MEKKEKTVSGKAGSPEEEVLELDELFGVQGGVNADENHNHVEETCGLGYYNMNIVIKRDDEKK